MEVMKSTRSSRTVVSLVSKVTSPLLHSLPRRHEVGRAASQKLIASTPELLPDAKVAHAGGTVARGEHERSALARRRSARRAAAYVRATQPRDRRLGAS